MISLGVAEDFVGGSVAIVLLAEDDGPLLRLYCSALRSGHIVIPAETAAQAINAIDDERPDLVIVDLNVPDAPGTAILDYVSSHPELADLQVVVITGFANFKRESLPDVVVDVLHKPVTTSLLMRVIDEALSARNAQ
jgi:DNA-binding NtrC family response regulator